MDIVGYRFGFIGFGYVNNPFLFTHIHLKMISCFCNINVNVFIYIVTDDLSFKKVTSQSSTWPGTYTYYQAKNAVDRDITTCIRPLDIGLNSPRKTVWWKVDLGGVYNIYSFNILFKNYDGYGMYFYIQ